MVAPLSFILVLVLVSSIENGPRLVDGGAMENLQELDVPSLENYQRLHALATKLESVTQASSRIFLETDGAAEQSRSRDIEVYKFLSPSKLEYASFYWRRSQDKAEEFRKKAYEFSRPSGFMGGLFRWGTSRHLGLIANGDPELQRLADSYERKGPKVDARLVDCDMSMFLTRRALSIDYLLQTDIKYTIMEDLGLVQQVLFEHLKAAQFQSRSNFYNIQELNSKQAAVLEQFYADRIDPDQVSVEEAVDHFRGATKIVIGRLFESCSTLIKFDKIRSDQEADSAKWCLNEELERDVPAAKRRQVFLDLCHQLMDNLEAR